MASNATIKYTRRYVAALSEVQDMIAKELERAQNSSAFTPSYSLRASLKAAVEDGIRAETVIELVQDDEAVADTLC